MAWREFIIFDLLKYDYGYTHVSLGKLLLPLQLLCVFAVMKGISYYSF